MLRFETREKTDQEKSKECYETFIAMIIDAGRKLEKIALVGEENGEGGNVLKVNLDDKDADASYNITIPIIKYVWEKYTPPRKDKQPVMLPIKIGDMPPEVSNSINNFVAKALNPEIQTVEISEVYPCDDCGGCTTNLE